VIENPGFRSVLKAVDQGDYFTSEFIYLSFWSDSGCEFTVTLSARKDQKRVKKDDDEVMFEDPSVSIDKKPTAMKMKDFLRQNLASQGNYRREKLLRVTSAIQKRKDRCVTQSINKERTDSNQREQRILACLKHDLVKKFKHACAQKAAEKVQRRQRA
jgi:hypothetical protein